MTRAAQRQALKAFSRNHTRELHLLLAIDLGRFSQVVFQQLYNRMQWEGVVAPADNDHVAAATGRARRPLAARLERAFVRRSAAAAPHWRHAVTPLRESEGS